MATPEEQTEQKGKSNISLPGRQTPNTTLFEQQIGPDPIATGPVPTKPSTTEPAKEVPQTHKQMLKERQHLIEVMMNEMNEGVSDSHVPYETLFVPTVHVNDEHPLYAFKAKTDPDTMYYHQALQQPDKKQFIQAMDKELNDQMAHGNFTVQHRDTVPEGVTVLPTVWALRQKRKQDTGEIHKSKGRLNVDGSRQHCLYLLYTGDSILVGPTNKDFDDAIATMHDTGLKLTIEGKIDDFIGFIINRKDDGTSHLSQHHLIEQILKEKRLFSPNVNVKQTPTMVSKTLSTLFQIGCL